MAKYCKQCWDLNENPLMKFCRYHYYEYIEKNPEKKLKRTPINKVWVKKTTRLKSRWSELKMFMEIWEERYHICFSCNNPIKNWHPSNFAHILSKWMYPKYRLMKANIAMVHGIFEWDCHKEIDYDVAGNKKEIEEILLSSESDEVKQSNIYFLIKNPDDEI